MYRMIGTILVLAAAAAAKGQPQQAEKKDVTRTFAPGQLEKYFKLVKAELVVEESGPSKSVKGTTSETYSLKLEAIKDVDLSALHFKVGLFDKNREALRSTSLRFRAQLPLLRGESVTASFILPNDRQEGNRLVIRQVTVANTDSASGPGFTGKGKGGKGKGKGQ